MYDEPVRVLVVQVTPGRPTTRFCHARMWSRSSDGIFVPEGKVHLQIDQVHLAGTPYTSHDTIDLTEFFDTVEHWLNGELDSTDTPIEVGSVRITAVDVYDPLQSRPSVGQGGITVGWRSTPVTFVLPAQAIGWLQEQADRQVIELV